jgi:hypothetical protein
MTSITFTVPGTVKWTVPANVTSYQVECGAAAAGGPGPSGTSAGTGGGAGEYAAEPAVTGIPGTVVYGFIGQGGTPGSSGGDTTWNGGQVTANGGYGNTGGSGSTNTVHHNGGNGGNGGGANGGGGGGGSAGAPSGAGHAGANGTGSAGGAGGAAVPPGGAGGHGGAPRASGSNGLSPGGGGGGAGGGTPFGGGPSPQGSYGGNGWIRITWTSAPGAPSTFPLPSVPFFPAGYSPAPADLGSWLHDPFSALENRPVARFRQASAAQALPSSGAATVLEFDVVDEDPLGGWQPGAWAWGPPAGWSAWYQVTVTLFTQPVASGNVIRPGITAPGSPGPVGSQLPGAGNNGGAQGTFWVYLIGGQDTVQATGALLNASVNVNTDIGATQQSAMEVTWLSA